MDYTYNELVKKVTRGEDGSLQLHFKDATVMAEILLRHGYAVLFTDGDIKDHIRISWVYAGDTDSLDYANRDNVAFGNPEFIEDIATGNYIEEEDEGE